MQSVDSTVSRKGGGVMISQIELISGICKVIEKHGMKNILHRQLNAIIEGANIIIESLNTPFKDAYIGCSLDEWLRTDQVGQSSKYLAFALSGEGHRFAENNHPHDWDDFGRCITLLDSVLYLRLNLERMADPKHGKVWNAIYANWRELERLYREAVESKNGKKFNDRLYQLIRS